MCNTEYHLAIGNPLSANHNVNISRPSNINLHQSTRPPLVQIMACRLFQHQDVIWTNAKILLIGPLRKRYHWKLNQNTAIVIPPQKKKKKKKKKTFKISSEKWRPIWPALNVCLWAKNTAFHMIITLLSKMLTFSFNAAQFHYKPMT